LREVGQHARPRLGPRAAQQHARGVRVSAAAETRAHLVDRDAPGRAQRHLDLAGLDLGEERDHVDAGDAARHVDQTLGVGAVQPVHLELLR